MRLRRFSDSMARPSRDRTRIRLIVGRTGVPCGYLTDPRKECRCTPRQVQQYLARISGPLLDRIDLQVEMPRLFETGRASVYGDVH